MADRKSPIFNDEARAIAHLEGVRWPNGPICPYCKSKNVHRMGGTTQAGMFLCNDCRKKFTSRVCTLMERSHLPVHKWLLASKLILTSRHISAEELARTLDISQKSAIFLRSRISTEIGHSSTMDPVLVLLRRKRSVIRPVTERQFRKQATCSERDTNTLCETLSDLKFSHRDKHAVFALVLSFEDSEEMIAQVSGRSLAARVGSATDRARYELGIARKGPKAKYALVRFIKKLCAVYQGAGLLPTCAPNIAGGRYTNFVKLCDVAIDATGAKHRLSIEALVEGVLGRRRSKTRLLKAVQDFVAEAIVGRIGSQVDLDKLYLKYRLSCETQNVSAGSFREFAALVTWPIEEHDGTCTLKDVALRKPLSHRMRKSAWAQITSALAGAGFVELNAEHLRFFCNPLPSRSSIAEVSERLMLTNGDTKRMVQELLGRRYLKRTRRGQRDHDFGYSLSSRGLRVVQLLRSVLRPLQLQHAERYGYDFGLNFLLRASAH